MLIPNENKLLSVDPLTGEKIQASFSVVEGIGVISIGGQFEGSDTWLEINCDLDFITICAQQGFEPVYDDNDERMYVL